MQKHAFGIAALAVGILALGLAVIPGIALDRPLPFADKERERPPEAEKEGGVTFKFKDLSVTFGGGKKDPAKDPAKEDKAKQGAGVANPQRPLDRDRLLKWFTISAVSCSLIGLVLGPISWTREKQPALAGSAIGICCLALVWQYIVFGIVAGVAIAVLLIILSHFGA